MARDSFLQRTASRSPILRGLGGILKRWGAVSPDIVERTKVIVEEEVIREVGGDPLAWGYVADGRVGSRRRRDLAPGWHRRARDEGHRLWMQHPLGKKAVRLKRSFVCQEGFKLEADGGNEIVQEHLDEHWDINWEGKLHTRVESLAVYGEWAFVVPPPNTVNGHYELGMLDLDNIEDVYFDPLNAEKLGKLVLSSPVMMHHGKQARKVDAFDCINYDWLSKRYAGEVLYLGVNRLNQMTRGLSDLAVVFDWLDAFDQLCWTEMERVKALRAFLYDVYMEGATDDAVLAKQKQFEKNPPKPGSFFCHNEKVSLKAESPNLNTHDTIAFLDFVQGLSCGVLDMPQHFYYTAGDVNRASAEEMTDPVYAGVRDRKREVSGFMAIDANMSIQVARSIPGHPLQRVPLEECKAQVTSRDPEKSAYDLIGDHLEKFSRALIAGQSQDWISNEQAGKMYRDAAAARGLGEIPAPHEESDNMAQAQQEVANALELHRPELEKVHPFSPNKRADWAHNGQKVVRKAG